MNNNYLIHFGVKGMKWGVRKSKYDKDLIKQDRDAIMKADSRYGRSESTRIAKNTQKRMSKKGESHSVALSKAKKNDALKQLAKLGGIAVGAFVLTNPAVRRKANAGAWILGRATAKTANKTTRVASAVAKTMNKNIINVKPITSSQGYDTFGVVAGLLKAKN